MFLGTAYKFTAHFALASIRVYICMCMYVYTYYKHISVVYERMYVRIRQLFGGELVNSKLKSVRRNGIC